MYIIYLYINMYYIEIFSIIYINIHKYMYYIYIYIHTHDITRRLTAR